jgi:hypothetical protein
MKKLFYPLILIAILINFESCKKNDSVTPTNPSNPTGTVYDSIIGNYSGTHEYSDSNNMGGLLTTAKVNIYKVSDGRYKITVSNIFNPYSFEISNGQKLGNAIVFEIGRQIYLGSSILYGDYSYTQNGQSVSLIYNLSTKDLEYGIEISSNGNFAGYHRGYYTKN